MQNITLDALMAAKSFIEISAEDGGQVPFLLKKDIVISMLSDAIRLETPPNQDRNYLSSQEAAAYMRANGYASVIAEPFAGLQLITNEFNNPETLPNLRWAICF